MVVPAVLLQYGKHRQGIKAYTMHYISNTDALLDLRGYAHYASQGGNSLFTPILYGGIVDCLFSSLLPLECEHRNKNVQRECMCVISHNVGCTRPSCRLLKPVTGNLL